MRHLVPCFACHRHVRVDEEACPFCGAVRAPDLRASAPPPLPKRRLGRAALFAFGATIAGASCGTTHPLGDGGTDGSSDGAAGASGATGGAGTTGAAGAGAAGMGTAGSNPFQTAGAGGAGSSGAAGAIVPPYGLPPIRNDGGGPVPIYGGPPPNSEE